MKTRSNMFRVVLAVLAVGIVSATVAQADLIAPSGISASASSYINIRAKGIYAVNGGGLTGTDHAIAQDYKMWVSGIGCDGQYLTIDLAENYDLDSTHTLQVWNMNNSTALTRGVKNASFWYLPDDGGALLADMAQPAGAFTQLTNVTTDAAADTFDIANGLAVGTNYNVVNFNEDVTARYVRIRVEGGVGVGNYGDANPVVGLSEVQVFGAVTPVPEPGTLALVGSGVLALLAYAWRKRRW